MYALFYTTKFKKDVKRFKKESDLIGNVLKILQTQGVKGIPATMRPHRLKGEFKGCLECHIKPDLLLI